MAKVIPGRYTAQTDEPFVVFMIGMRVNRFFAFTKWIPTAMAMGPMLRTLYQNPEKGFLGGQTFFYWQGIALVQYWRSLRTWKNLPGIKLIHILVRGVALTKLLAQMVVSVSGTRPTWLRQGVMR